MYMCYNKYTQAKIPKFLLQEKKNPQLFFFELVLLVAELFSLKYKYIQKNSDFMFGQRCNFIAQYYLICQLNITSFHKFKN